MDNIILQYGTSFAIGVRILAVVLLLFFCIPLQVKEVAVKNGLRLLRVQLLAFGILLLIVNIVTFILLLNVMNQPPRLPNSWLQIINALAFFGASYILNAIYRTQYTDESKELHKQIAEQNKEAQI